MDNLKLNAPSEKLQEYFFALQNPKDIAAMLEIRYSQLLYYLYRIPMDDQYTVFDVPKKSEGRRQISAPITPLKIIQSKLNQVLQAVYVNQAKPSVHGFIYERNIVTNASVHRKKRYVLNLDISDFFPSINFGRVRGMFIAIPYELPDEVATVLAQICCWNNLLPQGAPTSPVVSNMICSKMDSQLQRLAKIHKCYYTRYADDITFSTSLKNFPRSLALIQNFGTGNQLTVGEELESIIKENGFELNPGKLRLQSSGERQEVTGIVVNEFPNLTRRYVRQIRAMLHAWEKYGEDKAEQEYVSKYLNKHRYPNKSPISFRQVVHGKIEFLGMVRGKQDAMYHRFNKQWRDLAGVYVKEEEDKMTAKATRIFLSYASENIEQVRDIYGRLKTAGYIPWMDKEDLIGGTRWEREIEKAIKQADLFVLCLSKSSVNKRGVLQKEILFALDKAEEKLEDDIFIIPLRLEVCDAPERMSEYQWVDLFEKNGWERLVQSIQESIRRIEENK
jgi:RNA-directed DNA polymerase